jgi:hypothetical protein
MPLAKAERERRALIRANRPAPLSDVERARSYRDRKRAVPRSMLDEVTQVATRLLRAELALLSGRRAFVLEFARRERRAAEQAAAAAEEAHQRTIAAEQARRIADGTLHPDGRPWHLNEAIKRPNTPTSIRSQMEAARRAVLQAAIESFNRTGAMAPDPLGPRRRVESVRVRDYGPWAYWHRDY